MLPIHNRVNQALVSLQSHQLLSKSQLSKQMLLLQTSEIRLIRIPAEVLSALGLDISPTPASELTPARISQSLNDARQVYQSLSISSLESFSFSLLLILLAQMP